MEISVGEDSPSEEEFRFQTIGEQLKAERERQGLSLSDLAAKTRVPMRHLDAIETSDFAALPGTTYSVGFARSYARAIGMDATKVSSEMREELAQGGHQSYKSPTQNYEPADPSRVPSRTLAWTAAAIGVAAVIAYLLWRNIVMGDVEPVSDKGGNTSVEVSSTAQSAAVPTATDPNGEVVLTATDSVWVKIYDADNKPLFESEMVEGDRFTVPKDANKPMIVTGRPNAINVTIDGKLVPALGLPERTIVDVEISASALTTRKAEATASAGNIGGDAATDRPQIQPVAP